jgi:hypothetical protein
LEEQAGVKFKKKVVFSGYTGSKHLPGTGEY